MGLCGKLAIDCSGFVSQVFYNVSEDCILVVCLLQDILGKLKFKFDARIKNIGGDNL